MARGRFAPSPTGRLHLGNLRTAIIAQQLALNEKQGSFLIRMEDLDSKVATRHHAEQQLADLAAIGVTSGKPVLYQSERLKIYERWIAKLTSSGFVYECFCSRREIRESVLAPHLPTLVYPGTCQNLSSEEREMARSRRRPSLRLRSSGPNSHDVVLRRNDGIPAYNLAVVVDDHLQAIEQVVRGADLEIVTSTQLQLHELFGIAPPQYVHVPLMTGPDGRRMAKRNNSITLGDCVGIGFSPMQVRRALENSIRQGIHMWPSSSSLAEWLESLL